MAGQGSLFSIGDDDLDLGDEDFLLAEAASMAPTTAPANSTNSRPSLQQNNNTKTTINKKSPTSDQLPLTNSSVNSSFLGSFDDDFGDDNIGSFLTKRRSSDSPVLGVQPPKKQTKTSNSPSENNAAKVSSTLQGREQKIGGITFNNVDGPSVQGRSQLQAILNKIQGLSSSSNQTQLQSGSGLRMPVADSTQSPAGKTSKPGKFVFKPVNKTSPNSPSVPSGAGFTLRPNNVFNANGGRVSAVSPNMGGSPLLTSGVQKSPTDNHNGESPGATGRLSRLLGGTSNNSNSTKDGFGQGGNDMAELSKGNSLSKVGSTYSVSTQLRTPTVSDAGDTSSSSQLRNSASLQNRPASKGHVFGSKVNNSQQLRVPEANNDSLPSTVSSGLMQCNPGIQTTRGLRNPADTQFNSSGIRNTMGSTEGIQNAMGSKGTLGTSQSMQPRFTQARPRLPQRGGHSFAPRTGNISSTPRHTGQYSTPRVPQPAGMVAPRMQQTPRFQQTPRMQYTPTMHQTPRMPQGRGGPIRQRSPNGPSSGLYNSSFGQNTLSEQQGTPVCTSRLLKLCNASKPKDLTPRVKKRKFPGPAGILPKLSEDKQLDDVAVATPQTPSHSAMARKPKDEDLSSSQLSQEDPRRGSWDTMKKELGLHEDNSSCILGKNNIALVLRRASLKLLPQGKVPQLCVWVKLLSLDGRNGSVVFRDHTGEMQGTIHQKVLEEYPSDIKVGTTLVLRQVGVFSPSARNHYLNITLNNIVQVYPPGTKSGITSTPSSQDSPELNLSPAPSWLKFQDTSPTCTRGVVSQRTSTTRGDTQNTRQHVQQVPLSSAVVQNTTTVGIGDTQKTRQHVQQSLLSSALGQNTAQVSNVVASGATGNPTNTGSDGGKQQQNVDELWGEDNLDELLEDIGEEMFGDF
uniref:Homologous recombination OB-fold protein OB-fold domain-containing protein n=1 Tax=Branchiostoma floridae TaxID=7739 RepID=C3ZHE6_BRAFL|eukprot:XP_002591930.1 hypothetical protein BRAFLDRAFT_79529 [Branchiostoma floridae]